MSDDSTGLFKLGGAAFIVSGVLFLATALIELVPGPPPSSGVEIMAWVASGKLALEFASETLFFAVMFLVPGVIALYHGLAGIDRAKAATGCGIFAVSIAVLAMLVIVQGRLVYPAYGIGLTPAGAELVVALFYGGMHAVNLLLAVATVVLSLAMTRGEVFWKSVAYLGFVTSVADIIGSYPWAIGPVLNLVCQAFLAAWFVAVGSALYRMRQPVVGQR